MNMYNGNLNVTAGKDAVAIGGGKGAYITKTSGLNVNVEKWKGNGGSGGTFAYYGGIVTVQSGLAAFGKAKTGTEPEMK